jgi:putative FmdB family regulatory protein
VTELKRATQVREGIDVPIYEYTCQKCQTKFEKLIRSMSNGEKIECPKCGSSKTARALSVFAVGAEQAKGSSSPAPGMCGRCGGPGPCAMD